MVSAVCGETMYGSNVWGGRSPLPPTPASGAYAGSDTCTECAVAHGRDRDNMPITRQYEQTIYEGGTKASCQLRNALNGNVGSVP